MLPPVPRPDRLLAGAAGLALAAYLLVPGVPVGRSAALIPRDSLNWEVSSTGSRAGADLVWRGTDDSGKGRVTVRVEYAGLAERRTLAVWPVTVWLFVAAPDERDSFAAELSGGLDWSTGEMRTAGLVMDGPRAGAGVEQTLRVYGPRLAGRLTLRFIHGAGASSRLRSG